MAASARAGPLQRLRRSLPGVLLARGLGYAPRFDGRARRSELALTLLVGIGAGAALGYAVRPLGSGREEFAIFDAVWLSVLTGLPIIAAIVRRLHDLNRPARALLIAFFPYIGWAILGFYLVANGSEGDNYFGPNPRL
jgi:uncharacterized membrane protein YhaH (DUF805 family)